MVLSTKRPSNVSSLWPLGCAAPGGAVQAVIGTDGMVTTVSLAGVAPGMIEKRLISSSVPLPGDRKKAVLFASCTNGGARFDGNVVLTQATFTAPPVNVGVLSIEMSPDVTPVSGSTLGNILPVINQRGLGPFTQPACG